MLKNINLVEAASELADRELRKMFVNKLEKEQGGPVTSKKVTEALYEEKSIGCLGYKEKPQEIFNNLYDEFWEILETCK